MFSKGNLFRFIGALFVLAFCLSACSVNPDRQPQGDEESTPVPTPTRDPSGYQAVPARSCLIADWPAMQSDRPLGDLIAWQPGTSSLAYMAPADRSSWYIGDLTLAIGPTYEEKINLAPDVLANGDLTWSPDGQWLAFLAYRSSEAVYTIMVVREDGSELTDLFPTDTARTDGRTSQKAIIGWKDSDIIEVLSSCGELCRLSYTFQLTGAQGQVPSPTPVGDYHQLGKNLEIHRNELDFNEKSFPRAMSDDSFDPYPNWSPDKQQVVYLDRRGLLWLLDTQEKIQYLLDIGLRDVYETQWSSTVDYVAIRAEDRTFIFQVPCAQTEP